MSRGPVSAGTQSAVTHVLLFEHIPHLSHEYIYKSHFNALQPLNHVVHNTDTTPVPVSRQHFTCTISNLHIRGHTTQYHLCG